MRGSDVQREIDRMAGNRMAPEDNPLQDWYIVEFWLDGERRGHMRRGESIEAVFNEECAKGVDVINVIQV